MPAGEQSGPTADYEGLLYSGLKRVLNTGLGTGERYEALLDLWTLLSPIRDSQDDPVKVLNRTTSRGQMVWLRSIIRVMGRAGYMGRGKWRE